MVIVRSYVRVYQRVQDVTSYQSLAHERSVMASWCFMLAAGMKRNISSHYPLVGQIPIWLPKMGPKHSKSIAAIRFRMISNILHLSYRRKFRSETSDNMDSWKSRGGKSQREADKKWEDQRRERVRRKKVQVREKVGRLRFTMFFTNYTTLFTLHYTTLPSTPLHSTPLRYTNYNYSCSCNYGTLHYSTQDYTTLPNITLHDIHYTTTHTTATTLH